MYQHQQKNNHSKSRNRTSSNNNITTATQRNRPFSPQEIERADQNLFSPSQIAEADQQVLSNAQLQKAGVQQSKEEKKDPVFTKISQAQFDKDLDAILKNKDVFYQGKTSWCGAFAALYLAATLDEDTFKHNTIDLYQQGYVEGGYFTFDLDASDDLYNESRKNIVNESGIDNMAAFVAASTFKTNYLPLNGLGTDLDADDYTSEFWGITYAEDVVDYLTTYYNIEYKEGDGRYDWVNHGVLDAMVWDPVQEMMDMMDEGYTPLVVVDYNAFKGGEGSVSSQHYMVVKSISKKSEDEVEIEFFNPNGGLNKNKLPVSKWESIINWYGGFKEEK